MDIAIYNVSSRQRVAPVYEFKPPLRPLNLFPSAGHAGTIVAVRGSDLHPGVACRFSPGPDGGSGSTLSLSALRGGSVAAFVSPGLVLCEVPAYVPEGTPAVELSSNGADFWPSGLSLTVLPEVALSTLAPRVLPSVGGTAVRVSGATFSAAAPQPRCRFGAVSVVASVVDATGAECVAPAMAAGGTPFARALGYASNGVDYVWLEASAGKAASWYVLAPLAPSPLPDEDAYRVPELEDVFPSQVFLGGTPPPITLTLRSGAVAAPDGGAGVPLSVAAPAGWPLAPACRLGTGTYAAASSPYADGSAYVCRNVGSVAGFVAVTLSRNGADVAAAGALLFREPVVIAGILPRPAVGERGGVLLWLTGANFAFDGGRAVCRFGALAGPPAVLLSSRLAVCETPAELVVPPAAFGASSIVVELSASWDASLPPPDEGPRPEAMFVGLPAVSSVSPVAGPNYGGTLVRRSRQRAGGLACASGGPSRGGPAFGGPVG